MHSPFPKNENIEKDMKRLYLLLFCISLCSMIFVFAQSALQMSNYPPSVTTVTVDRDKQAWKVNPNLQSNVTAVRNYIVNRLAWMDDAWCTIDGIRLNGKPHIPGLYVHRGGIVSLH